MPALLRAALAAFRRHRQARRTYQILREMTQRELDDLGMAREDLMETARNSVANPAPKGKPKQKAVAAGRLVAAPMT